MARKRRRGKRAGKKVREMQARAMARKAQEAAAAEAVVPIVEKLRMRLKALGH